MISIKYDDTGKVTNIYRGERAGGWVTLPDGSIPEAKPDEDESAQYYYDEATGEISVEYVAVTSTDGARQ